MSAEAHAVEAGEGYRLLALAFRHPDPPALRDELAWVAGEADRRSFAALAALARALHEAAHDDLPARYNQLFAQSGAARANETSFVRSDKGARLGQLAMLYEAFGARTGGEEHEAPDFVGVQLEFAALLRLKESMSLAPGHEDDLAVTRGALRVLLEEHLGAWLPAFAANMSHATDDPFYVEAATRARDWAARDLESRGWAAKAQPMALPVLQAEPGEESFTCGALGSDIERGLST